MLYDREEEESSSHETTSHSLDTSKSKLSEEATVTKEHLCSACGTNKIQTIILPCHHTCLCSDCAKYVESGSIESCPICNELITTYIKIQLMDT